MKTNQGACQEIADIVDAAVQGYVDKHQPNLGKERRILCIEAGKALAMLGSSYISLALGIEEGKEHFAPALDMIEKFQDKLKRLIQSS